MRVLLDNGDILTIEIDNSIRYWPEINLTLNDKKASIGLLGRLYHKAEDLSRIVTAETIEEIIKEVENNLIRFK